jgi:hypothetical protein
MLLVNTSDRDDLWTSNVPRSLSFSLHIPNPISVTRTAQGGRDIA